MFATYVDIEVSLSAWSYESRHRHFLLDPPYHFCSTLRRKIMHTPICFTTDSSDDPSSSPFCVSPSHPDSFQLLTSHPSLRPRRAKLACVIMSSVPQPPLLFLFLIYSHSSLPIIHPSIPPHGKMRNARVHSRLNEVNIAGMLA